MPSPKYPLKPLLEHRERKVDDATAELGDAVRAREAFGLLPPYARGELRVEDLARGQAWEFAASARIGQLARKVETAVQKVDAARTEEAEARAELARKMADRDVVAKDQARFEERATKRALAAEEEAAEEAFRGGRSR
ncbi:MAG TPA: hypothetical protein VM580_34770 [Labilithrix sp.]|nr:hypothetical protein [Labilithrix sp.]